MGGPGPVGASGTESCRVEPVDRRFPVPSGESGGSSGVESDNPGRVRSGESVRGESGGSSLNGSSRSTRHLESCRGTTAEGWEGGSRPNRQGQDPHRPSDVGRIGTGRTPETGRIRTRVGSKGRGTEEVQPQSDKDRKDTGVRPFPTDLRCVTGSSNQLRHSHRVLRGATVPGSVGEGVTTDPAGELTPRATRPYGLRGPAGKPRTPTTPGRPRDSPRTCRGSTSHWHQQ